MNSLAKELDMISICKSRGTLHIRHWYKSKDNKTWRETTDTYLWDSPALTSSRTASVWETEVGWSESAVWISCLAISSAKIWFPPVHKNKLMCMCWKSWQNQTRSSNWFLSLFFQGAGSEWSEGMHAFAWCIKSCIALRTSQKSHEPKWNVYFSAN